MAGEVTCDKCNQKVKVGIQWSHPQQLIEWLARIGWVAEMDNETIEATYCDACVAAAESEQVAIPEVVRAAVIDARPGDVLVLEYEAHLPPEHREYLQQCIRDYMGMKAIVLDNGLKLAGVLRVSS